MISEEINRIKTAKADIKQAIEDRGIEVPSNTKLDGYADLINDISFGGIVSSISQEDYDPDIYGTTFDIKKVITEINFPEGITTISQRFFVDMNLSLKQITIPSTVTTVGNMAFYNSSLQNINWKSGNTTIAIGDSAFGSCKKLTDVTLPSNLVSIGANMFYKCSSLSNIVLPRNLQSIGDNAFRAAGLTEIRIPNTVTTIGSRAFADGVMEHIIFENNSQLTNIDTYGFNSSHLEDITLTAIVPPSLASSAIPSTIQNIFVPTESVEAYKTATNWSTFANKIQPIPTA